MANRKQKVAVIGAGISGVGSAVHLNAEGLDVTVFERSSFAGGIWVFDERTPPEPRYPSTTPSTSDLSFFPAASPQSPEDEETLRLNHAPPGPCYESLKNNVPTFLLKLKDQPWKPDTEAIVRHNVLAEYIQEIPKREHIESLFRYDTRVVDISKLEKVWTVKSETLVKSESGSLILKDNIEEFDAVVVASGHYHSCKVPDIPGLADLKQSFPDQISHSKSYRHAEGFRDQTVLLVGAGVSSNDIAKDIASVAKGIIQVSREGVFDLPVTLLDPKARRVGPIKSFVSTGKKDDDTLPTEVHLEDGTVLSSIHKIIFCTGYFMTYPFLPQLHNDALTPSEADDKILVTDGLQTHNLHKDIFYMPDPSLAFVGVPYNIATFSFFEFQAIAVASVFAGKTKLPSGEVMREEYAARIKQFGSGREFHSLHGRQREYVADLVEWVNKNGGNMEGHTPEWIVAHDEQQKQMKALFGDFGRGVKKPSKQVEEKNEKKEGWVDGARSLISQSA